MIIMKLGTDIEEVKRFNLSRDNAFLQKVFTNLELDYAFGKSIPAQHLCGFFCAKEAYIKAIGDRKVDLRSIEICHNESGAPFICVIESDLNVESGLNLKSEKILVSISHTKEFATATVIIY
jgi:holo-[acyl-carrier protein] synthase